MKPMLATDDRAWAREATIADVEGLLHWKPCTAGTISKSIWTSEAITLRRILCA